MDVCNNFWTSMPVFLLFLVKGLYSGSQDQTNQARDVHFFVLPKWSRNQKGKRHE